MGSREFSLQVSDPCKILLNCKFGVTTAWIVCRDICVPAASFFFFLSFFLFISSFFLSFSISFFVVVLLSFFFFSFLSF